MGWFRRKRRAFSWLVVLFLVLFALILVSLERCLMIRHRLWPDDSVYDHIIAEVAVRQQISPSLVKAVIRQESNFDPLAVGAAGERGLMQLMGPAVADWEEATGNRCRHQGLLFSPRLNIEIGTWYLARAMRRWEGYRDQEALALAEYNAGPSRARQWAPENPAEEVIPRISFPGTRNYIEKVLHYKSEYESGNQAQVRD